MNLNVSSLCVNVWSTSSGQECTLDHARWYSLVTLCALSEERERERERDRYQNRLRFLVCLSSASDLAGVPELSLFDSKVSRTPCIKCRPMLLNCQSNISVRHYRCAALIYFVNIRQKGRFWAASLTSGSSMPNEDRPLQTFQIQMERGLPGGLLQLYYITLFHHHNMVA